LKLPDTRGALLERVEPGTPAAQAGIQAGDVIREWEGHAIDNDAHLFRRVGLTEPNSLVEVDLIRDGVEQTVQVSVGLAPAPRLLPSLLSEPTR
jgi:S1-C subfamily serine protease